MLRSTTAAEHEPTSHQESSRSAVVVRAFVRALLGGAFTVVQRTIVALELPAFEVLDLSVLPPLLAALLLGWFGLV